ncbi:hypothetical protein [Corynebacterium striatum]|uniref:hypothetical protein n=1 Tax=Corynebacterium striatum TaxID=43770 RepID=UPI0027BAB258|nr:hypothetical protein [Corynebacterium striatum]
MPYVEMTAADLPRFKGRRVVLIPEAYSPDRVADRLIFAAQEGGIVFGATRDGRFTLNADAPVLIDPNQ